jgi:hypothetical protein
MARKKSIVADRPQVVDDGSAEGSTLEAVHAYCNDVC